MANHAMAYFETPVDRVALARNFTSVNISRFDDLFLIIEDADKDGTIEWRFEPKHPVTTVFGYWLHPNGLTLEWRHSLGFDPTWWVQEFIASHALAALKVPLKIGDEGIGDDEFMKPDYFEKYPHFSDWIKVLFRYAPGVKPPVSDFIPEPYATLFG